MTFACDGNAGYKLNRNPDQPEKVMQEIFPDRVHHRPKPVSGLGSTADPMGFCSFCLIHRSFIGLAHSGFNSGPQAYCKR